MQKRMIKLYERQNNVINSAFMASFKCMLSSGFWNDLQSSACQTFWSKGPPLTGIPGTTISVKFLQQQFQKPLNSDRTRSVGVDFGNWTSKSNVTSWFVSTTVTREEKKKKKAASEPQTSCLCFAVPTLRTTAL